MARALPCRSREVALLMLRPNPLSELGAMADRPQPPNEVAAGVIGGRQAARDIKRRERRHLPEERAPSPHERCVV